MSFGKQKLKQWPRCDPSGIDWDSAETIDSLSLAVGYALDRDLAEFVNKYHPEFKDGGY